MQISIVTPVYNDPRVERCLKSVQNQKGEFDVEHIVVDGESTDKTVDIIEANQEQIDCLVREDDDGVYEAMNKGIQEASGDIIGILNSDDRYQHDGVLNVVQRTMGTTGVDACYGDLVYVDAADSVVRYWQSGEFHPWKFYLGWMPPHPTFFVDRSIYDELGGFDEQLSIAADYELMLRALVLNHISVSYIDDVLVRMAIGGQSNESFHNMLEAITEMYHAWAKHDRLGRFIAPFLHPVEKIPQYFHSNPT